MLGSNGVQTPHRDYLKLEADWQICSDFCKSESTVKSHDVLPSADNYLIPFSPFMGLDQFNFYKSEAEFPGITAEFCKLLIGGILKKEPSLKLPDGFPEEASQWILDEIGVDNSSLLALTEAILRSEIPGKTWLWVDYDDKPFINILEYYEVINWRVDSSGRLDRVYVRSYTERYEDGTEYEFHPKLIDTIHLHELVDSKYQVRIFEQSSFQETEKRVNNTYELVDTKVNIKKNNKALDFIPIWPANGIIKPSQPIITSIVYKEKALYNKISRRNHLMYGAATYTPVLFTDIGDEDFRNIVNSGLGTWVKLGVGDRAEVLKTPTEALSDMEAAIAANIDELAKLGIRSLAPEKVQSGVALGIRNAAQDSQLGLLATELSATLSQVIAFMLEWRYNKPVNSIDIECKITNQLDKTELSVEWLRLITDWYQAKLIPRSSWISNIKRSELLDQAYNDEDAIKEINEDEFLVPKSNVIQDGR